MPQITRALWRRAAVVIALVTATLRLDPALATTQKRALVIGNSSYAHVSPLSNPRNDAADLAAVLKELGFAVDQYNDLGQIELLRALQNFQKQAANADIALIYYAGHGIEVERRNYLIPVDAELRSDRDINFRSVSLDLALQAVEGAGTLSVVILDACRDNPFLKQMTRSTRSIGRGLAAVEPEGNTLVAYAAKEGTVAQDGEIRNSPYATALMQTLREPGVEIGKVFRRVRDRVLESTNGVQEPFLYGSLSAEDIYLNPPTEFAAIEAAPAVYVRPTAPAEDPSVEIAFWNSIADSSDPRDFEDYLAQYPNGAFTGLAQRRLDALTVSAPPPRQEIAGRDVAAIEPMSEPQLSYIPTRADVRETQERLNALGYDAGPVDGSFGPRTSRAIDAYQRSKGMRSDGLISAALLSGLRADVSPNMLSDHRAAIAKAAAARKAARVSATPARAEAAPAAAPSAAQVTAGAKAEPAAEATRAPAEEPRSSSLFGGSVTVDEPDYSDGFQKRRNQREQRGSWGAR